MATLVGATSIGSLPVQAAAPTLDITPDPTNAVVISNPWVDDVHYTIDITQDQDFWLYVRYALVGVQGEPLNRLTSSLLDADGRFYIEDHDYSRMNDWGGLYLQPVDASLVDDGQTAWLLGGTLDAFDVEKGPSSLYVGTQSNITDPDSQDLARQSLRVKAERDFARPQLTSVVLGRDLASIEFTYDQDLIAEDLTWGGATYEAVPGLTDIQIADSANPGMINPTSIEIVGDMMIARLASAFDLGTIGTLTVSTTESFSSGGPGPFSSSNLNRPTHLSMQQIAAPSTTPPALAGDTAPVVSADGEELTLTFDYALGAATPAVGTLTVTAGDAAVAVASIANDGATSVLTLASAISQGAAVTVSYDAPASGGYQDAAGNLVADFTDQVVTNNSTVTAPSGGGSSGGGSSGESASTGSATTTTTEPAAASTTPTLVTSENQAALTASPGTAKALVNGEEVELTVSNAGNTTAGETAPEERTAEQVAELQEAADSLIENLDEAAGGDSGLTVIDTDTGAEIDGIFDDVRVPVEDVIVAETEEVAGLYASRDADGNVNKIRAELLETERGGEVAVYVYGLPAGEQAELVLMSTPYLLTTATADSSGNFAELVSAPDAILAGDHTLVTASGTFSVSIGLRITEPDAADTVLPATGGEFPMAPVLVIIGLGSLLLVVTRRRELLGN